MRRQTLQPIDVNVFRRAEIKRVMKKEGDYVVSKALLVVAEDLLAVAEILFVVAEILLVAAVDEIQFC